MPRKSINNKHHRPCRSVDALKMFNESENEMNGEESRRSESVCEEEGKD